MRFIKFYYFSNLHPIQALDIGSLPTSFPWKFFFTKGYVTHMLYDQFTFDTYLEKANKT